MQHALARAIEPSDTKEELAEFLDGFGAWIITAVTETFPGLTQGRSSVLQDGRNPKVVGPAYRVKALIRTGPNKGLQPTPYSVRCAPASRRG